MDGDCAAHPLSRPLVCEACSVSQALSPPEGGKTPFHVGCQVEQNTAMDPTASEPPGDPEGKGFSKRAGGISFSVGFLLSTGSLRNIRTALTNSEYLHTPSNAIIQCVW